MRRANAATLAAVLLLAGCASGPANEPEVRVLTVKVPESRTPRASSFSTVLQIEIRNPLAEALTVDRIQLSSVSVGTYTW